MQAIASLCALATTGDDPRPAWLLQILIEQAAAQAPTASPAPTQADVQAIFSQEPGNLIHVPEPGPWWSIQ